MAATDRRGINWLVGFAVRIFGQPPIRVSRPFRGRERVDPEAMGQRDVPLKANEATRLDASILSAR